MWILTTRNRQAMCQEVLDACVATGSTTPGLVWMDGCRYEGLRLPLGWAAYSTLEHLNIGEACRRFTVKYPNLAWYGWMADDCVPLSMGWDQELVREAGAWGVAYPNDGWKMGRNAAGAQHVTSIVCFGGEFVRSLGALALERQIQMYIDDYWESVAVPCGLMRYRPDVLSEHRSFKNGKRAKDSTDTRQFNGIHFPTHDRALFERWVGSHAHKQAIERVRMNMETSNGSR